MSAYLQIDGIKGESHDEGHENWINLVSCNKSIKRPVPGSGSGSTRHRSSAKFEDIFCVKEVDCSTPKIAEAVADGSCFKVVKIDFCTSSEGGKRVPYLQFELKNARVTSYSFNGTGGDGSVPTEQISFNYEEIKQTYDKIGKDNKSLGKVAYGWKIEEGIATA